MSKFLKFILTAFLLALLTPTVFKWFLLFFFAALSLPFLFITQVVQINFHNLSDILIINFPLPKLNIYPTPFPIVYMNPKFIIFYKNVRFLLVYLTDFLSFLLFIFLLFRFLPKSLRRRIKNLRPSWVSFKNPNFNKAGLGLSATLIILAIIAFQILILPIFNLYSKTKNIASYSQETFSLFKTRDFVQARKKLELTREEITLAKDQFNKLSWINKVPFVKNYYDDARSLFKAADYGINSGLITADILPTINSTSLEKINEVSPQIEEILNNFSLAKAEIDRIDPGRYPKKVGNILVREKIVIVKNQIEQLEETRQAFQPLVNIFPELIGAKQPRRYLILFQDENNLRPTGGIITAFGIFKIEKGRIFPEGSGDIAYLEEGFFNLRDTNISPDFAESMQNFEKIYRNSRRGTQVDGIIAIDGEFFVNLLKALGPTVVYENALAAENRFDCNCPAVIDDIGKLIKEDKKKDIIGVFLNAILVKLYSSPVKTQFDAFLAISKSSREKHLLVYLNNPNEQKAVETAHIAGRITGFEHDYLHISEADLSQNREDRYLKRTVEDRTEINPSGEILKTLTITYQKLTPATQVSPLLLRFYLPQRTQVLEINNPKQKVTTTESLGKTVFETNLEINPQAEKKIILKYRLPFKHSAGEKYRLFRQKQPGITGYEYALFLNGEKRQSFFLESDREIILTSP